MQRYMNPKKKDLLSNQHRFFVMLIKMKLIRLGSTIPMQVSKDIAGNIER